MGRSCKIETVKVHDFVPHRDKIVEELLLRVLTSVNFRQGPELGVGTEDEVHAGAGPLELACLAITPFKEFRGDLRVCPSTGRSWLVIAIGGR